MPIITNKEKGWVKGQPLRYVNGHFARMGGVRSPTWNGGVRMYYGYRTLATGSNSEYRLEHVLVAERALGKPLPPGAIVHHSDENRSNNRNDNLVICQDHAYHRYLHRRMRALKESGHADWYMCSYCKRFDDPANMHVRPFGSAGRHAYAFHRECGRKHQVNDRIMKRLREIEKRLEVPR